MTEIDRYKGHEPDLEIVILKDETNNQFIKTCIYKSEIVSLEIGENTYRKRLDKLSTHFPFVIFDITEAKKYGLEIRCDGNNKFWSYANLTCDPEALELVKHVKFDEAIGCHLKEAIFMCPKCHKKWQIKEAYDSHHGYARQCSILT